MGALTIADIDVAEHGVKRIRVLMNEMGRELYKMRNGDLLGAEYAFDGYSRQNYAGSGYYEQEGPDWGVGTPILSLRFYWSRAQNSQIVTLPMRYLTIDWQIEEAARLNTERLDAEAAARDRACTEAMRLAISEREQFERLKAKFEPPKDPSA